MKGERVKKEVYTVVCDKCGSENKTTSETHFRCVICKKFQRLRIQTANKRDPVCVFSRTGSLSGYCAKCGLMGMEGQGPCPKCGSLRVTDRAPAPAGNIHAENVPGVRPFHFNNRF